MLPKSSVLLRGRGICGRSVVGIVEGVTPGLAVANSQFIRILISRTRGPRQRKQRRGRWSRKPVSDPRREVTTAACWSRGLLTRPSATCCKTNSNCAAVAVSPSRLLGAVLFSCASSRAAFARRRCWSYFCCNRSALSCLLLAFLRFFSCSSCALRFFFSSFSCALRSSSISLSCTRRSRCCAAASCSCRLFSLSLSSPPVDLEVCLSVAVYCRRSV